MNSLERAIKVLEMMGRHSGGLTNSQISRYLHISTSSTSYLLSQLEREGCVKRDEDTGRYQVGLRLVSLAHGALRATGLQGVSDAVLYELAETTRLTVAIGVLERDEVLFIQKIQHAEGVDYSASAPFPVRRFQKPGFAGFEALERGIETGIGAQASLLGSASGRVLLAFLPPDQARKLLLQESLVTHESKAWEDLPDELKQIRLQGHAVVDSGRIRSMAAPIKTRGGSVRASLTVIGSRSNPAWEDLCGVVSLVREAAVKVSRRSGGHDLQHVRDVSGRVPKTAGAAKATAEAQ